MKYTIKSFEKEYPNDEACLFKIFNNRYGNLEKCPECRQSTKFHKIGDRKCFSCQHCGYQIYPLANTIFHKSSTSLKLWFYAIFLFSHSKNGVSAKELERHIGVTYKTAYRMAQQIRKLMAQVWEATDGTFEADETYIGGKSKNKAYGRGPNKKTPVIGVIKRGDKVASKIVEEVSRYELMNFIKKNVSKGANLITDEFSSYSKAGQTYNHKTIKHGKKEYVRNDVHTNTIEGFWSQLKRSIHGTYHAISSKHLQSYIDEFSYRYNLRHSKTPIFHTLINTIISSVGKQSLLLYQKASCQPFEAPLVSQAVSVEKNHD